MEYSKENSLMAVETQREIRAMKPGLSAKMIQNDEFDASATRDGSRSTQIENIKRQSLSYGAEIVKIVNGEESEDKLTFKTDNLGTDQSYTWITSDLQPNTTYNARAYITNGLHRKYSGSKTSTTPSTSKATLSDVVLVEDLLIASILDDGGRKIEDVGFVASESTDRKELIRKEKKQATVVNGQTFSIPLSAFRGGKTYFFYAYAIDNQDDTGYGSTPLELWFPLPVEAVVFEFEEVTIEEGSAVTLKYTVQPEDATDKTVIWSTSDAKVATVDNGTVTAIKEGTALITASVGDATATCNVVVKTRGTPVSSVVFSETQREVYIGEMFTIHASVSPEDATDKTLTWESSDTDIATVSQDGIVTPVGIGNCAITATAKSGQLATFSCTVVSEAPVFPDPVFREYVYTNFDTNNDGFLSREEALRVNTINISGTYDNPGNYSSLDGIEFFSNLQILYCEYNQVTNLDVSSCPQLSSLYCGDTQISSLDLSNCAQLQSLNCYSTQISSLDVTNCPQLSYLECGSTQISSLDVSNCPQLQLLYCYGTQISSLDVSNCPQLQLLYCYGTQISSLDVSNCPQLRHLECGSTQISSLDVTNCSRLERLECNDTQIEFLDISNCTQLQRIGCANTFISSLDVSKCSQLESLCFNSTAITSIDVTNCPLLKDLWCIYSDVTSLDLRNNTNLNSIGCYGCPSLTDIWLIAGHEYETLLYDQGVATLHYE